MSESNEITKENEKINCRCKNCKHFDQRFVDDGLEYGFCKLSVEMAKSLGFKAVGYTPGNQTCHKFENKSNESGLKCGKCGRKLDEGPHARPPFHDCNPRKFTIMEFNFTCSCCTGGERDYSTKTEISSWEELIKFMDKHEPEYIYFEEVKSDVKQ